MPTTPGPIAILGSGELSDSMAEVHRRLMDLIGDPVRPVFIDTPAGFEPNVDQIAAKAVAYFNRNFGLPLAVAHYHNRTAPAPATAAAVTAIRQASYLLAGPGSPSYAVNVWHDSQVWQAIEARWQEGAALVFASAAALALGRYTIPVYEIYKAGHEVCWRAGLDLLGHLGLVAALVPHWNNASGEQHDTRFAFMGAARFSQLEQQLPPETTIIGVDEYTALIIDPVTRLASVLGSGQVTLRHVGRQRVFGKGDDFAIDASPDATAEMAALPLSADPPPPLSDAAEGERDILALRDTTRAAFARGDSQQAAQGVVSLSLIAGAGLEQGLPRRAERAVESLQTLLPLLPSLSPDPASLAAVAHERATLLDLLIRVRADLRGAKQYALADTLRQRLADLGYILEDGPTGTTWRRDP